MEWGNDQRLESIQQALQNVPHNQTSVGLGFKLNHNPTNCQRCRAEISLLELSTMIASVDWNEYEIREGEEVVS